MKIKSLIKHLLRRVRNIKTKLHDWYICVYTEPDIDELNPIRQK